MFACGKHLVFSHDWAKGVYLPLTANESKLRKAKELVSFDQMGSVWVCLKWKILDPGLPVLGPCLCCILWGWKCFVELCWGLGCWKHMLGWFRKWNEGPALIINTMIPWVAQVPFMEHLLCTEYSVRDFIYDREWFLWYILGIGAPILAIQKTPLSFNKRYLS